MIYRNKTTGSVITTNLKVSGGDWVLVDEPKEEKKKEENQKKKAKKTVKKKGDE